MRTSFRATALLAALCAGGCASSNWERTESLGRGKLYVPRMYAPLLPGSIYPDRKVSVPAKDRPAVVVVCPAKGDCRTDEILDQAAQRGLVVLVGREPRIDLLRTRPEASADHIGWLLVAPTEDSLRRWIGAAAPGQAAAVIGPPMQAGAVTPDSAPTPPSAPPSPPLPSSPSKKILLSALLSAEPLEAGDGTILKLYSPNKKGLLPSEAFRDAVEWLAGELGSR